MRGSRNYRLFFGGALVLALMAALLFGQAVPASAQDLGGKSGYKADSVPLVTMKHWQESSERERYAFLIGFVTMLEMEKEWQGDTPLPFKTSLVPSWTRGFAGKSLKNLYDGLNNYLAGNPKEINRPVAEVLWFTFVQPTVTEKLNGKKRK